MNRFANIYVSEQCRAPQGVKTLLAINEIEYVEIDVSADAPLRELACGTAGQRHLPVVELDGVFAEGTNVRDVARALKLRLLVARVGPPEACC